MPKIRRGELVEIGIAFYRPDQWEQLLATAEDSEELESTWEEWRKNADNLIKNLRSAGIKVKEVLIDLNEFNEYCRVNNLPNNAETRSKYVSLLVRGSK